MPDLFKDIVPSILQTKKPVINQDNEGDYVPFIVNKALSFHYDCILQANEMNRYPSTDRLLQYHYLLNTVRGYKRPFQKWQKRETIEAIEAIKEYYKYSYDKAKEALMILSDDQINEIKRKLEKGGLKNDRHKRTHRGNST
jgi:hypothetical protein